MLLDLKEFGCPNEECRSTHIIVGTQHSRWNEEGVITERSTPIIVINRPYTCTPFPRISKANQRRCIPCPCWLLHTLSFYISKPSKVLPFLLFIGLTGSFSFSNPVAHSSAHPFACSLPQGGLTEKSEAKQDYCNCHCDGNDDCDRWYRWYNNW